ncbi:2-hydroxyacid dehydrogenase [Alkanindiges illinoisensis]|uniref:D-glycerate dehydrogenase n=1 Tax=Alkanindiges illinoisensis TaxID=197183 RepID=A0A4Y7XGR7_9GAMM|nr:D-glycerate dehydrogenase [Alkanindiges illinoisensis]TEU30746.1 D-glycerate dehydrogenase [Alkanindiges illinoisensis]
MKKTVVGFSSLTNDLQEKLKTHFNLLLLNPKAGNLEAQFQDIMPQADGMIGAGRKLDQSILQYAHKLKVISSISVGFDNYDVDYLNQCGILLTNTPDVLTETTADLAFALLMAAARRVTELDQWAKQGNWQRTVQPAQYGVDVYGKTLGIVGLGNIGTAMARRGRFGFNMNVLYYSQHAKPELEQQLGAQRCSLDELLQQSDFVSVHVALSEHTHHLIGRKQLAQMKKSAILINVARGQVIDEQALIDALNQQQILGAGLDVYAKEPLQTSPLFALPNVVTLPHIGSATIETRQAMNNLAFENLSNALNGIRPTYMVNPSVWPTL